MRKKSIIQRNVIPQAKGLFQNNFTTTTCPFAFLRLIFLIELRLFK